jgi:HAD superfamily hydrolase (TIGR01509 family)
MDGVIVDSEHQWMLAEGPFLRGLVDRWERSDHHKAVGMSVADLYDWLSRHYGLKVEREDFLARCELLACDIYRHRVHLARGLRPFIRAVHARGLALGLASSSPRSWVNLVLCRFGLTEEFEAVVTGDDAPGRTKPAPDIYQLAARRLDARPQDCLAVEDSAIGLRAARAAGMACVGLRSGLNDEQDLTQADWQVQGFAGLRRLALG